MKPDTEMRLLTPSDLEFAESLRQIAGWNQTYEDWQAFLGYDPNGCFMAEWLGMRAGTAPTTCYGTALAWVGMVLVHPQYRGRGIGRALLKHCLEHLSERRIRCVKLDATPFGKPLYQQLGFEHEWSLDRWETTSLDLPEDSGSLPIKPVNNAEMGALADFDAKGFGVPRKGMLARLASRSAVFYLFLGDRSGYGFLREGRLALYLGPVVSDSRDIARALILRLLAHRTRQKVYWDIPTGILLRFSSKEFDSLQRVSSEFPRTNENPGDPQRQFAIAVPPPVKERRKRVLVRGTSRRRKHGKIVQWSLYPRITKLAG
jgi:ribosomal protein S18 acetylase RimI-like enzyme